MTRMPDTDVVIPAWLLARERAQRRDRVIQGVAIGLSVLFLAAAAFLQTPLNAQRRDLQLIGHTDLGKIPPKYAWITAMAGSFRGLAIDLLWMRAEMLKEEGKYYEANQLADWICTLQPRFAAVWQFQAWNLSYNISVGTHTPEERWQWVYNGIRLLRDRGIPNNPYVVPLYKELSWIMFHKIGEMTDDMHWYYKREWASLMENLLGPPPASSEPEADIDAFRPIAEAPATWSAFLDAHPEMTAYLDAWNAAGVDFEATTSPDFYKHPLEGRFFERYSRLVRGTELALARYRAIVTVLTEEDTQFMAAHAAMPTDLTEALVAFLRAKVLREQYKMDPQFMLSLMTDLIPNQPGLLVPLDWRLAQPHAMYWSRYGVARGKEARNITAFDMLNTDRFTLFSLMSLCSMGQMVFEINRERPNESALNLLPDLRMVEPMHQMYLMLGPEHAREGEDVGETAGSILKSGHVNTLEQAIVLLWGRGQIARASRYLDYLRENYKHPDGSTKKHYLGGVEAFVLGQLGSMRDSFKPTSAMIHSFLGSALVSLSQGNTDAYARQMQRCEMLWRNYMKEQDDEREGRMWLPPLDAMRADALAQFMTGTPSLLARVAVWEAIDVPVRQQVYDLPEFVPYLKAQCEAEGYDFAKAFPEPPGMDEYRKAHPRRERPEEDYHKRYEVETP